MGYLLTAHFPFWRLSYCHPQILINRVYGLSSVSCSTYLSCVLSTLVSPSLSSFILSLLRFHTTNTTATHKIRITTIVRICLANASSVSSHTPFFFTSFLVLSSASSKSSFAASDNSFSSLFLISSSLFLISSLFFLVSSFFGDSATSSR